MQGMKEDPPESIRRESKESNKVKQSRGKDDDTERDFWIIFKGDAPDLPGRMSNAAADGSEWPKESLSSHEIDEELEKIIVDQARSRLLRLNCIESAGWFRSHRKERRCLFTPMKVSKGPNNSRQVAPIRVTCCESELGHCTIYVDHWKQSRHPHRIVDAFKGWTCFLERDAWGEVGRAVGMHTSPEGGCEGTASQ